jgi:broad specificity phosphatase PhoE
MVMLYLVRHAKPSATWGEATDPGLDEQGQVQAEERAADLERRLKKLSLYTSPMRRCMETARPLAKRWNTDAAILSAVAEIPSPPLTPAKRGEWLSSAMSGTWQDLQASAPQGAPDYLAWRTSLLDTLYGLPHDSVIYTHYVAINVAVGCAQGHDRVLSFRPSHAAVTTLEITGSRIVVRELGEENVGSSVLLGR